MNSYRGLFKMTFKGELQYRAKALSGVTTQFFWGFMFVYLYTAFMGGKLIDGFSISQMISYVWIGQAFFVLRFQDLPKNCAKEIENGDVCYKFVRPIDLYNQWFAENWGHKLAATLLRSPLIVLIAMMLPSSIGLMLPVSFEAFILFIVSLLIGSMMMSAISMIAVALIFKTASPKGVVSLVQTISGLLGGLFIPLPLMPVPIQNVINFLPFRFVTDLPLRIYVGNVSVISGLMYIGIALIWIVALITIGQLMVKAISKKAIIQGG